VIFLESLSTAQLTIWGTLGTILVACGLHAIVQQRFGHELLKPHNEVAGVILTVVGTLYSVILGFVVIVVWQGFTTASDIGDHEADGLAYVYRVAAGFPEPQRDSLRQLVRDYTRSILIKEWPRMTSGGKSDPDTALVAQHISDELVAFKPANAAQANLHAAALAALASFLSDRRDRLTYLESRIPTILWVVLLFGGVLMLGLTFLIGLSNRLVQLSMTGALAGMIAISLITIFELDSPLEGDTHVQPVAWELFAASIGDAPANLPH
jgi:hypothetical protein